MNREVHVRSLWGTGGAIPPVYPAVCTAMWARSLAVPKRLRGTVNLTSPSQPEGVLIRNQSGGDCADMERPENSARDTGSGAGPLRRLHGDMAKASHSRRAAQTTRPMTWTSSALRS